jgi:hypothetical protein
MSKRIDEVGKKYGRLLVIGRAGTSRLGLAIWRCLCDCGQEKIVQGGNLRSGNTQSCGCLIVELLVARSRTHGHTQKRKRSATFRSWLGMRTRCYNVRHPSYRNYGARSIKVCNRLRKSFENFLADMRSKPSSQHSIDRIDPNGHYSCGKCEECLANGWPMNCRWATPEEQANNRRNNILITLGNETKTCSQWSRIYGISRPVVSDRLNKLGWSEESALLTPVRAQRKHQ